MATKQTDSGTTTGYETELWAMADALRGSMDAAEYKHVVLGLVFLKYISDAFEELHAAVLGEWGEEAAEDRDEYIAENIFWVPPEARWARLKAEARQPTIGQTVDRAMVAIERDNPALKEVLPKDYARPALDKQRYPIVQYVWGRFWVNNHAHVIKGSVISDEHLYLLLRHTNITAFVTGAVQPKLNQRNLKAIPLVVPAGPTCRVFSRLVAPLFARLRLNTDECSVLAALRDTLLPKLISGEIRVLDVEQAVESVP